MPTRPAMRWADHRRTFMVLARITASRTMERLYLLPALGVQGALVLIFFFDVWLS